MECAAKILNGRKQMFSTKIAAGKLRQRIQIVVPTNVQDDTGGTSLANNTVFADCWGAIEALTGNESFAASEFVSVASHRITIRYRPGITARMQVWFKGRTFQIAAVLNPNETTKKLILACTEINDSVQQPQGSGS
jgi:SPP1 family predicted phage head-tail adaptor